MNGKKVPTTKKLKLLWSDEFTKATAGGPNPKYWQHDLGDGSAQNIPGWGNNERESYTKDSVKIDPSNGGNLKITAARPTPENASLCYYGQCEWYSGKLTTSKKVSFQYGLIEARIKMPAGGGTWPAFWMLGTSLNAKTAWPECGEIDIVETQGNNPLNVIGTVHGPGYSGGSAKTYTTFAPDDVSAGYHTYAVEWLPGKITWLLDGKAFYSVTKADVAPDAWPFDAKFFLIINVAMGGNLGGDIDPALQSATMSVDWIRYSSINGIGKVTYN